MCKICEKYTKPVYDVYKYIGYKFSQVSQHSKEFRKDTSLKGRIGVRYLTSLDEENLFCMRRSSLYVHIKDEYIRDIKIMVRGEFTFLYGININSGKECYFLLTHDQDLPNV